MGMIEISGASGIYKYPLYSRYLSHPSAIYIHLYFWGKWEGVFNNNFIIVFIIVNSYKSTSIPYYIYLASNLDTHRTGVLLVLGSISGTTRNKYVSNYAESNQQYFKKIPQ